MPEISNDEFLTSIFGADAATTHVTSFQYDPNNIPQDKHLAAWAGGHYKNYYLGEEFYNQYFTISHFDTDEEGKPRRRKALYRHTRVIVLDDVREKLNMEEVSRLPSPSWILETSPGSEQWGYILTEPCSDRGRVENLLDGLVANGLAPEGRDPGMKGVTRYVRLPGGYNTKASKMVNGVPFKCRMLLWHPFDRVTLEALAAPFNVNLDAVRRESRVDGASEVSDHPLIHIPELIQIKDVRSAGRFEIRCPWVEEHTGEDDSGAAVFTNGDGTIGFKCHHGACQHRTGLTLLNWIEERSPGFKEKFTSWKIFNQFKDVGNLSFITPEESAPVVIPPSPPSTLSFIDTPAVEEPVESVMNDALSALRSERPTTARARQLANEILRCAAELPVIERKEIQANVCDLMHWSKQDFKEILKELQSEWYGSSETEGLYADIIYVKEQNQLYDLSSRIFYSVDAFQNSFAHEDAEARKTALQEGKVVKVDKLDYAPKQPRTFTEDGLLYGNTWTDAKEPDGVEGDVSFWLNHWELLGWSQHRDHMLQWMAFTLLHPEHKINHMLLLGSLEGGGKDFLLYPLLYAMKHNARVIAGDELLSDFNDYIMSTKYLHINETELGDHKEATKVGNKLKPIAAAPPETIGINQKGIKRIDVRNIINGAMTTNSQLPLRLNGPSRRYFAVWSDLNTRDEHDDMTPEWCAYWDSRWQWMKQGGGVQACVWYLRNCVSLENFNPSAAPPMTDFLREIREASKSPQQVTVENFIQARLAAFNGDLVRINDAVMSLKAEMFASNELMSCDPRTLTPKRVLQVFKESSLCLNLKSRNKFDPRASVWAIRKHSLYKEFSPEQLEAEYQKQIAENRAVPFEVVNTPVGMRN